MKTKTEYRYTHPEVNIVHDGNQAWFSTFLTMYKKQPDPLFGGDSVSIHDLADLFATVSGYFACLAAYEIAELPEEGEVIKIHNKPSMFVVNGSNLFMLRAAAIKGHYSAVCKESLKYHAIALGHPLAVGSITNTPFYDTCIKLAIEVLPEN